MKIALEALKIFICMALFIAASALIAGITMHPIQPPNHSGID